MFKDKTSSAIVAVSDLVRARRFYGETLGLDQAGEIQAAITFRTGETMLIVYESAANAGTNKANAVVWSVTDDFDAIADELHGKGVRFEEYPELGCGSRTASICSTRSRPSGSRTRTATSCTSTICEGVRGTPQILRHPASCRGPPIRAG